MGGKYLSLIGKGTRSKVEASAKEYGIPFQYVTSICPNEIMGRAPVEFVDKAREWFHRDTHVRPGSLLFWSVIEE